MVKITAGKHYPPRLLVPRNYDLQTYCSNVNEIYFVNNKSDSLNYGASYAYIISGLVLRTL